MRRMTALTLLLAGVVFGQTPGKSNADNWDKIYLSPDSKVPVNPSALVLEATASLKAGTALDVGMGNGRNAVYLARKGWKVTGIDVSKEAMKQAQAEAGKLGVQIDARAARLENFDAGRDRYDLILCMYVQDLATRQARKIVESLKAGGVLVVEGHHSEVQAMQQGGPAPKGYGSNELLRAYSRLRILRYEDRSGQAEWYNGADGKSRIVRLVARKE